MDFLNFFLIRLNLNKIMVRTKLFRIFVETFKTDEYEKFADRNTIFSGRKELFEGLWIYEKWGWTRKFPVIRIDWTRISHSKMEVNRSLLKQILLAYGNYPSDRVDVLREKVTASLRNCDEQGFAGCLETLAATVPNELKILLLGVAFSGTEIRCRMEGMDKGFEKNFIISDMFCV
jgi:hypothetical protein